MEYENQYYETGTEKTEAEVTSSVPTPVIQEDNISNRKKEKQLKLLISSNKDMKKILKNLSKQITNVEKNEAIFNKNKNLEKTHLKDFHSLLAHMKAFKDALREEKYFLENIILENKKEIDKLKDALSAQK